MNEEKIIENVRAEIQQKLETLVNRICVKLVASSKQILDDYKKVDTAMLKKSIDYEIIEKQALDITAMVLANTHYAKYIHDGTGPAAKHKRYYPNLMAIRDWVKRRGIAANFTPVLGGRYWGKTAIVKYSGRKAMDDYWKVDKVARLIAWKIYQKGTVGVKFFDLAIKQNESFINEQIAKFNSGAAR